MPYHLGFFYLKTFDATFNPENVLSKVLTIDMFTITFVIRGFDLGFSRH